MRYLVGMLLIAGLAACSSAEKSPPASGEAAPVSSRTLAPVSSDTAARSSEPHKRSDGAATATAARGGAASEAAPPEGPRAVGSARAHRERLLEDEADDPAGRSEARFEADGTDYKPGVGLLPHYSLKTVDKRADPAPDPILEKALPGSRIDLPPPPPPKKPDAPPIERVEQPDEEPHPVRPRPVD